jgi:uncharacterized protein (TIGR03118 family)
MPVMISGLLLMIISSCKKEAQQAAATEELQPQEKKFVKDFNQVNLIGNNNEYSPARIDPTLINGWGIAVSPNGIFWVSTEGTGHSLVVSNNGTQIIPPVAIPSTTSLTGGGHPSGQVFNSTADFKLSNGTKAFFIFAGLDGTISGWNGGSVAERVVNDAGEVYSGITIAQDGGANFLYVANFSEKKIDVFDANFDEVDKAFKDPNLPKEYSPFNIQNIGGKLYVMYAKLGEDGDEVKHPGFGYVDIYNPDGSLVNRFVSKGQLNAPWGVAWAQASFFGEGGQNAILIGNFGDGAINAYSENGDFLGQLRQHGKPIKIEGLWGITFSPVNPNALYFAAGPDDETEGLFGYISK